MATSQLASSDIAFSLRKLFDDDANVSVKLAEVASVEPAARTVTTTDGQRFTGDAVVLAAGSQPNFFHTPGAEEHAFPLYALDDAQRLRSRIIGVFEEADRDPSLIEQGALNFVVVGGGPTGVELAGALADLIQETMSAEYHGLAVTAAQVHLVDLGHTLLGPFSERAHDYVAKVLARKGVRVHLGVAVTEVGPGTWTSPTAPRSGRAASCGAAGSWPRRWPRPRGAARPRRADRRADLTVDGAPGVYAAGDVANIPAPTAAPTRSWAPWRCRAAWPAENLLADGAATRAGRSTTTTRGSWR